MPFNTLFTHGFKSFINENRDQQGDLWFFVHIPKTAGTSFRAELADVLTPEANLHVYDEVDGAPHRAKLTRAVDQFFAADDATPHRFASGHIPTELLEQKWEGRAAPKLFTILRDPVARFISDYRYQRTSQHPGFEAFRKQFPRIEDYLGDLGQRNRMWQYLAPTADATVARTVDHLLGRYTFVGLLEMYPLSFRVLMRLLGQDREPTMHLRRTSAAEAGEMAMTPALLETIREGNSKDVELYDAVHQRLKNVRGDVFAPEA